MIEQEETDFLVDVLTAMCITQYCLSAIQLEPPIDLSLQFNDIIRELYKRGVGPEVIDESIKHKDFTNMLTTVGSGNREREFVMDYIEECYANANMNM